MTQEKQMSQDMYVISIVTENALRVLQRLSGMFSRYRVNIEHMSIFNNNSDQLSYFSVVVHSNSAAMDKLTKQVYKIIEVHSISIVNHVHDTKL